MEKSKSAEVTRSVTKTVRVIFTGDSADHLSGEVFVSAEFWGLVDLDKDDPCEDGQPSVGGSGKWLEDEFTCSAYIDAVTKLMRDEYGERRTFTVRLTGAQRQALLDVIAFRYRRGDIFSSAAEQMALATANKLIVEAK